MSVLLPYTAAICAAVAAWLTRGALAVDSAATDAARIGILPPWWELALFVVAGACVVFLLKPSRDRMMPLFITALCILPWLPGVRTPALLVWTGPLAAAAWLAAALACLVSHRWPVPAAFRGRAPGAVAAGLASLVFFSIVAFGAREMVPGGDEPHYLIITQSLLADGDLQIENNHLRRDYAPYFQGELRPDFWVRGTNGAIYSIHAPGLSALIAPAYVIGGYTGVVVFLLLVSAAGVALAWKLAFEVGGRKSAAWFAAASLAAATPIAFHTFTIYPDGPGAVLTLTGVWALLRLRRSGAPAGTMQEGLPPGSTATWVLHGLALGLLPWLHSRFAILAGLFGVFILLRMPRTGGGLRRAAAFLAFPTVLAAGWFAYFSIIYGTPNPNAPYGDFFKTQASWAFVTGGLAGVLFDQQFGMVTYAPVFLIAFAGWGLLLRREPRLALELAIVVIPYMIATTHLRMWWGGWSAPARFSVAVLWLSIVPLAVAWARARSRAARGTALGALLISAFTTSVLAYADGGRLAYNVRDGYSQWLEWLSPLGDLPLGFPSFFRWLGVEWALHVQIAVSVALFAAAFVVLRIVERRVRGAGAFALAMLAAYAVAGMVMLVLLWKVNDSHGIRPASAQLRLLRAAQGERRTAVDYSHGVRVTSPNDLLRRVRIESPPRMLGGNDPPALVLPGWFPAGRYRIDAQGVASAAYDVRILRSGTPILSGALPPDGARASVGLDLPVDVPAVILRGPELQAASLVPVHVATRRERFGDARGLSARRYGATVVWFLDGDAFNEPDGLWIRGGAESQIVVQPDGGRTARLLLRNGPVDNEVVLQTAMGEWKQKLPMKRDEEREVRVPVDPLRGATLIRVSSRNGFRPSEVDANSRDARYLGVWIQPR